MDLRAYFWVNCPYVLAQLPVLTFWWAVRSFFNVSYTKRWAVLTKNSGAFAFSGNSGECFHATGSRDSSGCLPSSCVCREQSSERLSCCEPYTAPTASKRSAPNSIAASSFRAGDHNRYPAANEPAPAASDPCLLAFILICVPVPKPHVELFPINSWPAGLWVQPGPELRREDWGLGPCGSSQGQAWEVSLLSPLQFVLSEWLTHSHSPMLFFFLPSPLHKFVKNELILSFRKPSPETITIKKKMMWSDSIS